MKKAAMVVAHPDDETLWGAGWILTHPEDQIRVYCCSKPRLDPERAERFFDACEILGVQGTILPNPDHPSRMLDLSSLPDLREFDYVVTHNEVGEYGNKHHIQVCEYVARQVWKSAPDDDFLYVFGRGLSRVDTTIRLSGEQASRKLAALMCYDTTSPADKTPKWKALVDRYFSGDVNQLATETYASRW